MSPVAMVLSVLGFVVVGLVLDAVRQRRLIRAMQERLGAIGGALAEHVAVIGDTQDGLRKQTARTDRLQRMVQDHGWRDSMMLTRFDWRKPSDRG